MIRDGSGKMKGRRNRRVFRGRQRECWPMFWVIRHQGPIKLSWNSALDHTKW